MAKTVQMSQLQETMKEVDKWLEKIYDAKQFLNADLHHAFTMLNEMNADDREKFLKEFSEEAGWTIGLEKQIEVLNSAQKSLNETKSKMEDWHK